MAHEFNEALHQAYQHLATYLMQVRGERTGGQEAWGKRGKEGQGKPAPDIMCDGARANDDA